MQYSGETLVVVTIYLTAHCTIQLSITYLPTYRSQYVLLCPAIDEPVASLMLVDAVKRAIRGKVKSRWLKANGLSSVAYTDSSQHGYG